MTKSSLFTPVLIAGCMIRMRSFAIRASFGELQIPVATKFGWLRADFSLAIAIQNLAWGIGQPLFSAFGERFGERRTIIIGALLYALGLVLSAYVFISHQIGSFPGVWLGGRFHDLDGDCALVWLIGVGVGPLSAIVHLPIRERRVVAQAA